MIDSSKNECFVDIAGDVNFPLGPLKKELNQNIKKCLTRRTISPTKNTTEEDVKIAELKIIAHIETLKLKLAAQKELKEMGIHGKKDLKKMDYETNSLINKTKLILKKMNIDERERENMLKRCDQMEHQKIKLKLQSITEIHKEMGLNQSTKQNPEAVHHGYKTALEEALRDGIISEDEDRILKSLRKSLGISNKTHDRILSSIKQEGINWE